MAVTKEAFTLIAAATNVPAGTTKAAPVGGATAVDVLTFLSGQLLARITNGGALGVACTVEFQVSPDGVNWFMHSQVSSSNLANTTVSEGVIPFEQGNMYVRAIAYGNTTSTCTVEAHLKFRKT